MLSFCLVLSAIWLSVRCVKRGRVGWDRSVSFNEMNKIMGVPCLGLAFAAGVSLWALGLNDLWIALAVVVGAAFGLFTGGLALHLKFEAVPSSQEQARILTERWQAALRLRPENDQTILYFGLEDCDYQARETALNNIRQLGWNAELFHLRGGPWNLGRDVHGVRFQRPAAAELDPRFFGPR